MEIARSFLEQSYREVSPFMLDSPTISLNKPLCNLEQSRHQTSKHRQPSELNTSRTLQLANNPVSLEHDFTNDAPLTTHPEDELADPAVLTTVHSHHFAHPSLEKGCTHRRTWRKSARSGSNPTSSPGLQRRSPACCGETFWEAPPSARARVEEVTSNSCLPFASCVVGGGLNRARA